jgi:hypothetical protein
LVTVSLDGTYIHVYEVISSLVSHSALHTSSTNVTISDPPPLSLPSSSSPPVDPLSSSPPLPSDHLVDPSVVRRNSIDNTNDTSSAAWLVTRQLYRIYRGITTATIRVYYLLLFLVILSYL